MSPWDFAGKVLKKGIPEATKRLGLAVEALNAADNIVNAYNALREGNLPKAGLEVLTGAAKLVGAVAGAAIGAGLVAALATGATGVLLSVAVFAGVVAGSYAGSFALQSLTEAVTGYKSLDTPFYDMMSDAGFAVGKYVLGPVLDVLGWNEQAPLPAVSDGTTAAQDGNKNTKPAVQPRLRNDSPAGQQRYKPAEPTALPAKRSVPVASNHLSHGARAPAQPTAKVAATPRGMIPPKAAPMQSARSP